MSTIARLTAFSAVLALVFGGAALAGSRIDAHPGRLAAAPARMAGHGAEAMTVAQKVRGLAVSEGGLTLALAHTTAAPGRPFTLAFRIVDRGGRTIRDFDVEHTKRMHVIVVRRDMTGFQHLHPTLAGDGSWSIPVTLPHAGSYRVFADFSVHDTPHTLAADVTADGPVRTQPLPAPADTVTSDGLTVHRGAGLAFTVTRGGRPVPIEDYLGAKGHLVALRDGDLAFLHVHPDAHRLKFMAEFPGPGTYRLFLQFQTGGRGHTAAFTETVAR
jgi:hypothetical protein